MNKELFLKKINKGKVQLFCGLFFGVVTLIMAIYFSIDGYKQYQNVVPLLDAKKGDYAYIDVQIMTDYFAVSDSKKIVRKSYILGDKEEYLYLAAIDENIRKELNSIYDYSYSEDENAVTPEVVRIKGMAETIPSDLQKLAIEGYNKIMDEKVVNASNFKDYFGSLYLDTYASPMSGILSHFFYVIPTFVFSIIFLIGSFNMKRNTKKYKLKYNEKWETILQEVEDEKTVHYEKAKVILTRNYVISYFSGLEIFETREVIWIYPYEYRYNGALTQKSIFVVTEDSKTHKIGTIGANKKNLLLFDEMYETLLNHLPDDVLRGYTKENKDKAREKYKK